MFPILKASTTLIAFVLLYISSLEIVKAAPAPETVRQQNELDAQALNMAFKSMKATDPCQDGQTACIDSQSAKCVNSQWYLTPCPSDTSCFARPRIDEPGTDLVCDIMSDVHARASGIEFNEGPDGGYGDDDGSSEGDGDCDDGEGDPPNTNSLPGGATFFTTITTTIVTQLPSPSANKASVPNSLERRARATLHSVVSAVLLTSTRSDPPSTTLSFSTDPNTPTPISTSSPTNISELLTASL